MPTNIRFLSRLSVILEFRRDCPRSLASCREYCLQKMASCRDYPSDSASCLVSTGSNISGTVVSARNKRSDSLGRTKYVGQSRQKAKIGELVYTLWQRPWLASTRISRMPKHGKGRKSWLNVTNGKYNFNILLFTSCINHIEIFLHKSYKIFLIFLSKCDNFNGTG